MSTTQMSKKSATEATSAGTVETKLEVVVLPVSDVERSKRFYMSLGWRLDADFATGDDWRAVQLTPPGSPCSVIFGKGFTAAVPGSVQGTFLVVDDVKAARAALIGRGVEVSEVFHFEGPLNVIGTNGRVPGPDPEGRLLPLVGFIQRSRRQQLDAAGDQDAASRTRVQHRRRDADCSTARDRGAPWRVQATAPKHHWSDWYAAYIVARVQGRTPEEAAKEGKAHMENVRG